MVCSFICLPHLCIKFESNQSILILHFDDLGDAECRLAANAVVLLLGLLEFNVSLSH